MMGEMVIGVDASRAFVAERTGTEEYAYMVLGSMLKKREAGRHEWVLYVRPDQVTRAGEAVSGWTVSPRVRVETIWWRRLWTQGGLAARTWIDSLDVLWVPAHTLPVLRRGLGGVGRRLGTVVTIHGVEYEYLPGFYAEWARWHLTWSTEYAVKNATKLISVSEFTKQALVRRLGADADKIEVIHEGVEVTPGVYDSGGKVLARYGLKPRNYILFVGTIQPRKNLARLIEAFAMVTERARASRLSRSDPGNFDPGNLKLVIAGKPGWDYEAVLKAPKRFGVEKRVVFTGYISHADRDTLLHFAGVYVQPSLTEGFGLPVLEAMAMGCPVVGSGRGAMPEVVGKAGLLFDPEDVSGMSEVLEKVLAEKGLRERLVRLGKQRAMNFSWERAARKTLSVLESVVPR